MKEPTRTRVGPGSPRPDRSVSTYRIRQLWPAAAILLASLLSPPVLAQESGHKWTHYELETTHNTQQQALASARAQSGGGYQYMTAIKKRAITETEVELTYGIPTEISQVNEWTYTVVGIDVTGPEQTFVDALKAKYDQQSTDRGCTPNTTITRGAEWATLNQWSDGVSQRQQAGYNVKWNRKSSGTCSLYSDIEFAVRLRTRCSNQYVTWNASNNTCSDDFYVARLTAPPLYCDSCTLVGDPVDFSTGDQYETENDIDLSWIRFDRYYHSVTSNAAAGFGYGWTHSHDIRLAIQGTTDPTLGLVQANGSHLPFRKFSTYYEAVDGSGDRITASGTNWVLQQSSGTLTFNAAGQLLEQRADNGTSLTYGYDVVGRLITITHSTGRSLVIAYSGVSANASIASISSAGEVEVSYGYNTNGQVQTAQYFGGTRTYHYEDPNFPYNLTGVTVGDGQRYSTFAYDAQGRSISAQLAGGADGVTVAYSAQGGAVVTDALGDATDYSLTTAGAATKPRKAGDLTDSKGTVERKYYDDGSDFRRRINTVKDRNGTTTKHTYTDANDPVTGQPAWTHAITEAYETSLARTREERRDSTSNRTLLTKVGNRETRITRNARLQPVSVTIRDTTTNQTRTTAYSYCEAADVAASNSTCPILGMLKSVDGPRTDVNDVTTFVYYGSDDSTCASTPALCTYRKGDLRKVTNALGRSVETLGYDPMGRPLSVLDPNGVVTDYEYDPRGRLKAVKERGADDNAESDDRITRISYWANDLIQSLFPPGDVQTTYFYDAAQRLTVISNGEGEIVYTLDKAGNRKKEDTKTVGSQLTRTLSRVYNTLGQLTALKDASQNATSFTYDVDGNPDLTTDALGRVVNQDHDSLNRLTSTLQQINGESVQTQLEYNMLDQVTKVTDPNGLNTLYAYNGFGDQTQLTSPDNGIANYTYNSAGLLATKQDANDAAPHRYVYDALNRPTAVFYTAAGAADVEYDYDTVNSTCAAGETFALGRVSAMRTEGTELKYCYDRFGQVVRKVQSIGSQSFTLRYAYTPTGRPKSVTYPDGAIAEYEYIGHGRIGKINVTPAVGPATVLLRDAIYQPFGPTLGWTYGNGRLLQRDYDLDYRPKSILDTASGGLSLGYGYNTVGDLTELKDGLLSTFQAKYDYDALGRLTVTRDGTSNDALESYEYDKTGNRKKLTHGTVEEDYVYPTTSHRLTSINTVGGSNITRSYDAIGNTIAIGGTAKEYVYNANDRMKQVKQGGVVTRSYRYNAKGERVAAINGDTGPVTTYTLYDEGGQWIGDYDSTGATIQQAIWMGNLPVGLLDGAGTAQSLKYIEPDHLGTPRAVVDPNRGTTGVAIWTWDAKSEAFGNSPPNQDPDQDGTAFVFNMRFPGQRHDPSTGLSYNYYRDYDPSVGRYIQADPIGLKGGLNLFSYVGSSPLFHTDFFGLQSNTVVCGRDGTLVVKVDGGQTEQCGIKACLIEHEQCHAKEMAADQGIVEFCSVPANEGEAINLMDFGKWPQKQALELSGTAAELACLQKLRRKESSTCRKQIDERIKDVQKNRTQCEASAKRCVFK
ncbi:RHS repeat-associated core domain-containing protein [Lysobacter capsici]|uniref:RHS repeat-associated core domain-containing protein n=1 Tax=Lysobacter capsici TaxID=435897 RepID=UPI001C001228|nr:RHS repeat-associated core domain-containing protein [Lysobacter capsici]QWF15286.1 RHS repeat protein [Lysobacter capsici]